jgi:hypothetical protein
VGRPALFLLPQWGARLGDSDRLRAIEGVHLDWDELEKSLSISGRGGRGLDQERGGSAEGFQRGDAF